MIEINDVIDFAVAIGTGDSHTIIKKIRGEKTLEDRLNTTFIKALDKWEISNETKKILKDKPLNYYTDLKEYLHNESKAKHPKIKELLQLWVQEMMNDELCMNFIIMHKQDITFCKLDDIYGILKNDILTQFKLMQSTVNAIYNEIKDIKQHKSSSEIAERLLLLLEGVVKSMIEELKLESAIRILEEIEKNFYLNIKENITLEAKLSYLKGKSLFFAKPYEAKDLIHKAYTLKPDENEYKKWELKFILADKNYEQAKVFSTEIDDDGESKALVDVITSDNEVVTFHNVKECIRQNYSFRQTVLEALLSKEIESDSFLFENVNEVIPTELTFSTINAWLFYIALQRYKLKNYMVLSFEAPQVSLFESVTKVTNIFFKLLDSTEIKGAFPMINCLHYYWSYICTKEDSYILEFQKINREKFGNQKTIFSLMEASMLILAKRFEEAFAVIVSVSKEMNESIIQFVILMSVLSGDILHLQWILSQMKKSEIKVNGRIAALIAGTIDEKRALGTKNALINVDFDEEGEKELLIQLCEFHLHQDVDVNKFKKRINFMTDTIKAYAANLLANTGDTQLAFEMLNPIINENTDSIIQSVFLSVLCKMQEKTPLLYKILVNNRKKGNLCNDALLWKEYELETIVADFDNALDAITELYQRHPDNVNIFAHYMKTLGIVDPQKLSEFENKAKSIIYLTFWQVTETYNAFAKNDYLETATEILYKAAKDSDDYILRNFYYFESLKGFISTTVNKQYDVAEEGRYVLCDKNGDHVLYKASTTGGPISKEVLGKHKGEVINVNISFTPTKLSIIGIFNQYFELVENITNDAKNGNNPGLQLFKIDSENPLESIQKVIHNMSQNETTPEENRKRAYEKYEKGEFSLMNLVPDNNMLSGYYNLLFTPFTIHVNNMYVDIEKSKGLSEKTSFVLDLPTILLFAEFEANTGLKIQGPKIITKVLHEYFRETYKTSGQDIDWNFCESMHSQMIKSYSNNESENAIKHIEYLIKWIDDNCKDVIADKALMLYNSSDCSNIRNILLSSISMLLNQNTCFVTDDRKINEILRHPNIISSEAYVKLFNNDKTVSSYSQFLFNCGFRGVDLECSFIISEYKKMSNHEENKMVAIIQNIQENPLLITKAITCCNQLARTDLDINTLRVTFINIFTLALKRLPISFRESVFEEALNYPINTTFTKQCLNDAYLILNSNQIII